MALLVPIPTAYGVRIRLQPIPQALLLGHHENGDNVSSD